MFIGLVEIAGYCARLQAGLEAAGIPTVQIDLSAHPFRYRRTPPRSRIVRLAESIGKRRAAVRRGGLVLRAGWKALDTLVRFALFLWAMGRFDVFIFTFRTSFLGGREFALLRLLRKRLVFVFFGSDSRPPYIDGAEHEFIGDSSNGPAFARRTKLVKRELRRIERYASVVICHPASAHLLERPYVSFQAVGIPMELPTAAVGPATKARRSQRPIRVLHAPSAPALKGTRHIRAAVAALQKAGHAIELVEVVGQPNDEVLRELERCDFVVDQLYSDTAMAGFAAEAASMGKPAIVGSLDWDGVQTAVGAAFMAPSFRCHPDDIEAALVRLMQDDEERLRLGAAARSFIEREWSMQAVAGRYVQILAGSIPNDWFRDPGQLRYVHGWGLPPSALRSAIQAVLRVDGVQGLQLADDAVARRVLDLASP